MKRVFSLISIFFISLSAYSQEGGNEHYLNAFEAERAVWRCRSESDFPEFRNIISETVLSGDTVVRGVKWRLVKTIDNIGRPTKMLLRTQGSKVIIRPYPGYESYYSHFKHDDRDLLLYDFSANVGDSTIFGGVVKQIDSIELNDGQKHRKIHLRHSVLIEGVGHFEHNPFFILFPSPTTNKSESLVCCYVNDKLLYKNPAFFDCEGSKVGNEIISQQHADATVHFSDDRVMITVNDHARFDVTLFNLQGEIVAQQKENYHHAKISLKNVEKGIYIVHVISENFVFTEKIIK